jgi:lipid A 3-O-deacylase
MMNVRNLFDPIWGYLVSSRKGRSPLPLVKGGWEGLSKAAAVLFRLCVIALIAALLFPGVLLADEKAKQYVPDRFGVGLTAGNTYSPVNNITFLLATGFALFDYEKISGHKAPEALRFKVEGAIGSTTRPDQKLMVSGSIFALYYLKVLAFKSFQPYVEGGIGIIYTDFQVEGQGVRVNFNPQVGVGTEFRVGEDTTMFASLRLHHISNAGLNSDNTGVNSVVLTAGRFF